MGFACLILRRLSTLLLIAVLLNIHHTCTHKEVPETKRTMWVNLRLKWKNLSSGENTGLSTPSSSHGNLMFGSQDDWRDDGTDGECEAYWDDVQGGRRLRGSHGGQREQPSGPKDHHEGGEVQEQIRGSECHLPYRQGRHTLGENAGEHREPCGDAAPEALCPFRRIHPGLQDRLCTKQAVTQKNWQKAKPG